MQHLIGARYWACAAALFLMLVSASAAGVQFVEPTTLEAIKLPEAVVTQHHGYFGQHRVSYTAVVEAYRVTSSDERPVAKLVTTSYIAEDEGRVRPVIFAFNGGPILASFPLHFGLLGPKRLHVPDDLSADARTFSLRHNPYAPLDVADIVLFDPASTGYSRVTDGIAPASQFSTKADARQLAQLVQLWLERHDREDAPVYLLGESYGTIRAPVAAMQLQQAGISIHGLILLGQADNILEYAQRRDNILSYVVSLPTLAALAWYHDKTRRAGQTLKTTVRAAWELARTAYLDALFLGTRATRSLRGTVATKLQDLTGIPRKQWVDQNLRITKREFAKLLVPGQVLHAADGRYLLDQDGHSRSLPRYDRVVETYYHKFLKVPENAGTYSTAIPTSGDLNDWDWGSNDSPFGDYPWAHQIRALLAANSKFRVLFANGYFDLQTTVGATKYLVSQPGYPPGQVRSIYYKGGHMMYTVDHVARKLANDIRAMVTQRW